MSAAPVPGSALHKQNGWPPTPGPAGLPPKHLGVDAQSAHTPIGGPHVRLALAVSLALCAMAVHSRSSDTAGWAWRAGEG